MYQTGKTIEQTLHKIQQHELVLPAIQREFVWKPEQIYRLFDSLMQGYPFGTFLYWQVEKTSSELFIFYDFVRNYHERTARHCPKLPKMRNQRLTAVLDGQQRLTALNIGLHGSMAWKQARLWRNNPLAYPVRHLYLDLLWQPKEDDEEGVKYRFRFLTEEYAKTVQDSECWFRVGQILSFEDSGPPMVRWLNQRLPQELVDQAYKTLHDLYQVIRQKHLFAFFEESSQDLEKVLQIFIRMNSGGTELSHSDLLLSVAVAQWTHYDAREEIHALVNELNDIGGVGFSFSKDLVLKAGLMLSDIGSVGFKVGNFTEHNMQRFESKWEDIKRALTLTVRLVSNYGFSEQNLRAHNAILPIAYYLCRLNPGEAYLMHKKYDQDREEIRNWLIKSLLKPGIWGSGLDTLLTRIREVLREEDAHEAFPTARIGAEMARLGKSLVFDEEELNELSDMQYGDGLTFALLSLIFPFIDLRNQFHVDHIFPKARFGSRYMKEVGVSDDEVNELKQNRDGLANLQLLQGALNSEKSATMPAEWLRQTQRDARSRDEYEERHLLGTLPDTMEKFLEFYNVRRERLKTAIGNLLRR